MDMVAGIRERGCKGTEIQRDREGGRWGLIVKVDRRAMPIAVTEPSPICIYDRGQALPTFEISRSQWPHPDRPRCGRDHDHGQSEDSNGVRGRTTTRKNKVEPTPPSRDHRRELSGDEHCQFCEPGRFQIWPHDIDPGVPKRCRPTCLPQQTEELPKPVSPAGHRCPNEITSTHSFVVQMQRGIVYTS